MIALFLSAAANVFLRSIQQMNVVYDKKAWVPIVSLAMASAEVYVIVANVRHGWHLGTVIATGLGSATGCLIAMTIHKRLRGC
jgi:hypothetical protein